MGIAILTFMGPESQSWTIQFCSADLMLHRPYKQLKKIFKVVQENTLDISVYRHAEEKS